MLLVREGSEKSSNLCDVINGQPLIYLILGRLYRVVVIFLICLYSVLIWREIFDPPLAEVEDEIVSEEGKILCSRDLDN